MVAWQLGHGDDLAQIGSKTVTENETLFGFNVHRGKTDDDKAKQLVMRIENKGGTTVPMIEKKTQPDVLLIDKK